jgi:hypothetical protein
MWTYQALTFIIDSIASPLPACGQARQRLMRWWVH